MASPSFAFPLILCLIACLNGYAGWSATASSSNSVASLAVHAQAAPAKAKPASTAKPATATKKPATAAKKPTAAKATAAKKPTAAKATAAKKPATSRSRSQRTQRRYSPWAVPTYADSTKGDRVDGDDLVVRRAAVEALGRYNGAVVVTDPKTGRVLTVVGQKTAIEKAYIPCSTVKIPVAMAGLLEGEIDASTTIPVLGRTRMDLTEAMAKSNNVYFEKIGAKMGFEMLSEYHRLWGLGERATLNLENENPGLIPPEPPKNGGAARMSSFGEGIQLTAMQLAALVAALSNGGTLHYLQYPQSQEELANFVPRVKRYLDIEPYLDDIRRGMSGAVSFGTARRANFDTEASMYGKTGTCTDYPQKTHMGWFGSYLKKGNTEMVAVVLLTGAEGVSGPVASGIAGKLYSKLDEAGYFDKPILFSPVAMIERFEPGLHDE
jgi:penicillin-binding protein 2